MKELKIEVPQGFEIDKEKSTFEKIVFKAIENKLPVSVEDIPNRSWYISLNGDIKMTNDVKDKNNISTKERAEAFLALMQLVELRDAWNGDYNLTRAMFHIVVCNKEVMVKNSCCERVLSFKSEQLRDQFAEQFKELIETAKELL